MQRVTSSVEINAPKEKVWKILWDDETYRIWTSVFDVESHAISDWKEGSPIEFFGAGGGGMYATIDKLVPNEYMSFKLLGEVKGGKGGERAPFNEATFENYTLTEEGGVTTLTVEVDIPEKYKGMFDDLFPQSLSKAKELAERE